MGIGVIYPPGELIYSYETLVLTKKGRRELVYESQSNVFTAQKVVIKRKHLPRVPKRLTVTVSWDEIEEDHRNARNDVEGQA